MEKMMLKQKRVVELLPFIAKCIQDRAVLIGGTALALFHLNHRISIDIDLAVEKDDVELSRELKGCLSKIGFITKPTAYKNVFTVNFEETAVRVEVFIPEIKIKQPKDVVVSGAALKVGSLDDLFELKLLAYKNRKAVRDLFDLWSLLKAMKAQPKTLATILKESGLPVESAVELKTMGVSDEEIKKFSEAIKNASS
ncbi:MAG: nucleotidyl transferase AbiEii/AbiGii toxin family protein [Candidatus Micrarchaeota archaeon]